jgi:hypothetical protein
VSADDDGDTRIPSPRRDSAQCHNSVRRQKLVATGICDGPTWQITPTQIAPGIEADDRAVARVDSDFLQKQLCTTITIKVCNQALG